MNNNYDIDLQSGILNGYICNTSSQIEMSGLELFDKIKFNDYITKKHWELYSYFSDEALAGEETDIIRKEFCYPIVCCRAQGRVILLSRNRKIINHLFLNLNKLGNVTFSNTYISVDQLVHHLFVNPKDYTITQVNAHYMGNGNALDYVMLAGNNISEADIFIKYMSFFNIFRCGLKVYNSNEELLRISNNGSISFNYTLEILSQIDVFFNYMKELNLLR